MCWQFLVHNDNSQYQSINWREDLSKLHNSHKYKTVSPGSSGTQNLARRCSLQTWWAEPRLLTSPDIQWLAVKLSSDQNEIANEKLQL